VDELLKGKKALVDLEFDEKSNQRQKTDASADADADADADAQAVESNRT
jgi:hypothetical protein